MMLHVKSLSLTIRQMWLLETNHTIPLDSNIYCTAWVHKLCMYQCKARGGGGGIGRAFDTIFRPLEWAFDNTGLPGGRAV